MQKKTRRTTGTDTPVTEGTEFAQTMANSDAQEEGYRRNVDEDWVVLGTLDSTPMLEARDLNSQWFHRIVPAARISRHKMSASYSVALGNATKEGYRPIRYVPDSCVSVVRELLLIAQVVVENLRSSTGSIDHDLRKMSNCQEVVAQIAQLEAVDEDTVHTLVRKHMRSIPATAKPTNSQPPSKLATIGEMVSAKVTPSTN